MRGKRKYGKSRTRNVRRRLFSRRRRTFKRSRRVNRFKTRGKGAQGRYGQLYGDNFAPTVSFNAGKRVPRILFKKESYHFTTSIIDWTSALPVIGTNNMALAVNVIGRIRNTWTPSSFANVIATAVDLGSTFDNYSIGGNNFPQQVKTIFYHGTSITLRIQNVGEANTTVRITFVKWKKGTFSHEWNNNVHHPLASAHYHILKSEKFVLNPIPVSNNGDIVSETGNTYIERKYYFKFNEYRTTQNKDFATQAADWELPRDKYIYMFVETDDTTVADGESILFTATYVDTWWDQNPRD